MHRTLRSAFAALGSSAALLAPAGLPMLAACSGHEQAPPVRYTLLDGKTHALSELRGKVVLVNFWATTCAPCLHEMPQLAALQRRLQARGFETLAVAVREDAPAAVADYAEARRLPFGVAIDNTGAIAQAFGDVRFTPTTLLIDARGRIVERLVGELDFPALQARIEAMLAPPPANG